MSKNVPSLVTFSIQKKPPKQKEPPNQPQDSAGDLQLPFARPEEAGGRERSSSNFLYFLISFILPLLILSLISCCCKEMLGFQTLWNTWYCSSSWEWIAFSCWNHTLLLPRIAVEGGLLGSVEISTKILNNNHKVPPKLISAIGIHFYCNNLFFFLFMY